jgi:hypothetical protein
VINPNGLAGAFVFLNGFKQFGYALAENQTIWFMLKRFSDNPGIMYQNIFWVYAACSYILLLALTWRRYIWVQVFFGVTLLAGFKAIRLMTPFSIVSIWMSVLLLEQWQAKFNRNVVHSVKSLLFVMAVVMMFFGILDRTSVFYPRYGFNLKPGLMPGVNLSAEFFKQSGLKGPVMSNYDIGGYLIYHLYPQEKVFVDNRQEAFPVDFFKKEYIPMQEDSDQWQQQQQRYGFNVIYFYRHDLTPWGQQFLINRMDDPLWAPVYVDGFTIIYARRGSVNQPVIDRYELPRSMFAVSTK